MVIVKRNFEISSAVFYVGVNRFVVRDLRLFEVNVNREGEFFDLFAIEVESSFYRHTNGLVVCETEFVRIDVKAVAGIYDLTGIRIIESLLDVISVSAPKNFAGDIVGKNVLEILDTSERIEINAVDTVGGTREDTGCDVVFGSFDGFRSFGKIEGILTCYDSLIGAVVKKRHNETEVSGLVFVENAVFQNGSLREVAEESEPRNGKIDSVFVFGKQLYETFHVITVFEVISDIFLFLFRKSYLNLDGSGSIAFDGDLVAFEGSVLDGDFDVALIEHISEISDIITVIGYAFGEGKGIERIRKNVFGYIDEVETKGIDSAFVGIVAEFDLGSVASGNRKVSFGVDCVAEVSETCALLADERGISCFVENVCSRAHKELICKILDLFVGIGRIAFSEILSYYGCYAGNVGRRHTRSAHGFVKLAVSLGNGSGNVAAEAGDFGLNGEVGKNSPGGEVGHIRTYAVGFGNIDGLDVCVSESFAVDHRYRADCDSNRFGHGHRDRAFLIVIDNNGYRAVISRVESLGNEGRSASLDESDLSVEVKTFVVRLFAVSGNYYVIIRSFGILSVEIAEEVHIIRSRVDRFVEEDLSSVARKEIRSLILFDARYRKARGIGAGGADRTDIGIGRIVRAARGSETGVIGVACGSDDADARSVDDFIDFVDEELALACFVGKSERRTE